MSCNWILKILLINLSTLKFWPEEGKNLFLFLFYFYFSFEELSVPISVNSAFWSREKFGVMGHLVEGSGRNRLNCRYYMKQKIIEKEL